MKHPDHVEGFDGTIDELAQKVEGMRYDKTTEFIEKLADAVKNRADKDMAAGRTELAKRLYKTAEDLYSARDEMKAAWTICEPHMK